MKDGGSYLQSDRSESLFQSFAKRQLIARPRREVVARRDDCDLSTGLLFSHFDPSIRIHARSLAATHLGPLDVIATVTLLLSSPFVHPPS